MSKTSDRRNHTPSEVRVMSIEEFSHLETLDTKVDALVENRNEVAIHNIEYILQSRNIPQSYMCNVDLEGTPLPPQMATYKKVGKDIPFRTIARIGMAYGIPPEKLFGQLLDQSGPREQSTRALPLRPYDEYMKYVGTYHMAYFGTGEKLGCDKRTTAKSLAYGVLSIYPGNTVDGIPTLHAVAFTNSTPEEQEQLILSTTKAEAQNNSRGVRACYEKIAAAQKEGTFGTPRMKCLYEGEVTLTERITEITLHQVKGSDVVHMELHNRAAISSDGSHYKGGPATMSSTSRGEEHMPCLQAVILSRQGFREIAKEELAEALFMAPLKINVHAEVKDIVAYMKYLFPGEDVDNPTSQIADSYKFFSLESFIEQKITEVIKHNVLGYYKISTEMDSDIYKTICR